jgi:hypothetical protein
LDHSLIGQSGVLGEVIGRLLSESIRNPRFLFFYLSKLLTGTSDLPLTTTNTRADSNRLGHMPSSNVPWERPSPIVPPDYQGALRAFVGEGERSLPDPHETLNQLEGIFPL